MNRRLLLLLQVTTVRHNLACSLWSYLGSDAHLVKRWSALASRSEPRRIHGHGGLSEPCSEPSRREASASQAEFQILRRTMATQAQSMGSVKDIQAHLRHAKADTTANEYMQVLPESVKRMVGEVYAMLTKGGESQESLQHLPQKAANSSEELAVSI
jgi:hypothetical protein